MDTKIYKITNEIEQKNQIEEIGELLKKGEAVAIPTETVYGIAANCFDEKAVEKIFEAKGRPSDNPLIVHIAEKEELNLIVEEISEKAKALTDKFWPGPLTIILNKKACIPNKVSANLSTVAVRMPSHPIARAIIKAAGVPLAAPSANISGFPSPTQASYVIDDMYGRLSAIVDSGECDVGIESTVITLAEEIPVLLRPGAVTYEQLCDVLGEVKIHSAVLNPLEDGKAASSPGMKYKHYSPTAKLTVLNGSKEEFISFIKDNPHFADYALCFEGEENEIPLPCVTFGKEDDSFSQAKRLFDSFRELDEKGAKKVLVRAPSRSGVGLGVCNRLYRACGFNFLSPKNGIIIGITGESGSGKSAICKILKEKGCYIIDADETAKEITKKGSPILKALSDAFGNDIIDINGELDRKLLAARAFKNYETKKLLDSITHPEIVKICKEKAIKQTQNGKCVIIDAPLLFTSGLWQICHKTVKIYAPENVRLKRVMERDNITEQEALLRFSKQTKESTAAKSADIIINSYPPFSMEEEIKKII